MICRDTKDNHEMAYKSKKKLHFRSFFYSING